MCSCCGCKCLVLRVQLMASLSIMVLPSLLAGSHQSVAGHRAGCFEGPEVGFVKIPHTNSYRISSSVHFIKKLEGTLAPSGSPNQSTSTGRSMGRPPWAARAIALGKCCYSPHTLGGCLAAWRRCNTFQFHHYKGLPMQPWMAWCYVLKSRIPERSA